MVLVPAMVISNGPPARRSVRRTIHLPAALVAAVCFWPVSVTVTCSPGLAVPQMGTDMPLCSTMWSLKSVAGLTSARAAPALN